MKNFFLIFCIVLPDENGEEAKVSTKGVRNV